MLEHQQRNQQNTCCMPLSVHIAVIWCTHARNQTFAMFACVHRARVALSVPLSMHTFARAETTSTNIEMPQGLMLCGRQAIALTVCVSSEQLQCRLALSGIRKRVLLEEL